MALATNLVAYYPLNSNGNDSVGTNNLTNTGCTFTTPGILSTGATFGTKLLSSTSPVTGAGAWSFSIWYQSSTTGTNKQILTLGDAAQGAKAIVYVYTTVGNAIQLDTSGAGLITSSNTSSLDGKWHHLVITSAGNSFVMYIDGINVGTGSTTGMSLGSTVLSVGYDNPNARWSWVGMLDEGAFWSRQLSADEVLQVYNNGKANAYPLTDTPSLYGTLAAYKLEGSGKDYTPNNFTLTNNNSVAFNNLKIGLAADGGSANTNKDLSIANNLGITNGAITLSCWVKNNTEISSAYYGFVTKGDSGTNVIYSILYDYNAGTRRLWFLRRKNNSADEQVFYTLTMGTTNVYHLAMTYDGTTLTAYVNGSSVGSTTASGNGASGAASQFNILTFADSGTLHQQFSNSLIDETYVWNRALSGTEISALYASGNGLTYPFNTTAAQLDKVTQVTATNTTVSKTFAHECGTGSNRILYVLAGCSTSTISSVTYNGVSMTRAAQVNLQTSWSELWYLVNPASGSNNVVITCAGSNSITGGAVSYTNAAQTGQPDATHADVSQTGSVTSYSQAITTVTDNDMILLAGRANGGLTLTGVADAAVMQPEVAAMGMFGLYGNIPVTPAQSASLGCTSTAQQFFGVMAAVKPYSAPVNTRQSNFFVFM